MTIRELFHSLGNDHNMVTVVSGVIKDAIEESLNKDSPKELKAILTKIRKDLAVIIKKAQEADNKTREIHDRVYKVIDPDTGKPK